MSRASHRARAVEMSTAEVPPVDDRPDIVESFLGDAAHMPGGRAAGITFPQTLAEVSGLVARAPHVLPIGARSSLTGGATPRGDIVLSTRALNDFTVLSSDTVRVGAGLSLGELQRQLAAIGRYYPPVPTYDGAFVGGTISTNAAGAATFKYGSTRRWVEALTLVLADGSVLSISRGEFTASGDGLFEVELPSGRIVGVPVPTYTMPDVPKLSAGYFAHPAMDLTDLFIGSEGTLGVVVDATLRTIARAARAIALVRCASDAQAIAVATALRQEAAAAWRGRGALDVAAIEFVERHALALLSDEAVARAGVDRAHGDEAWLFVQIEVGTGEDEALQRLGDVLDAAGVEADADIAMAGDERGAERLFGLREAVPSGVNARVADVQSRVHPDVHKTAGDMIVPFDRLADSLDAYRRAFERRGLEYAVWGHVSDGNLHPNVVPRGIEDVERGEEAILEIAREVGAMGGAPLAEHGVGRSMLKQRLLRELYGDAGIDQMRAVKRALDPTWKLSSGVIFPSTGHV